MIVFARRLIPVLFIPVIIFSTPTHAEDAAKNDSGVYPHVESSFEFRITNRRYVSHIACEYDDTGSFVTIVTTHPGVWAFHATSHAQHYRCADPAECVRTLRKLNDFLQSGWNIGLRLNGSQIQEIIFFERRGL